MKSIEDLPKAQFHVRLKEALGSDKEYYSLLRKQLDAVRVAVGQFLNIKPVLINLRVVGVHVDRLLNNTYRENHSAPLEIYIAPSGKPEDQDVLQRNQTNILEAAYKLENSLKKVKVHFNLNEPYVKDGIWIDDQFGGVSHPLNRALSDLKKANRTIKNMNEKLHQHEINAKIASAKIAQLEAELSATKLENEALKNKKREEKKHKRERNRASSTVTVAPTESIKPHLAEDEILLDARKRFAWSVLKMLSIDNSTPLPIYEETLKTYDQASNEEKIASEVLLKHVSNDTDAESLKMVANDYQKVLRILMIASKGDNPYQSLAQVLVNIDDFHDSDLCGRGLRQSTEQRLNNIHVALSSLLMLLKAANLHNDIWGDTQKFIDILRSEAKNDNCFRYSIHATLTTISDIYRHLLDHKTLFEQDLNASLDASLIQSFHAKLLTFHTDKDVDKQDIEKHFELAKNRFLNYDKIDQQHYDRIIRWNAEDNITKEIQKRFAWYMLKMLSTDNRNELPPYEATLKTYSQASDEEKKAIEPLLQHVSSDINAKSVKSTVDHYLQIFKLLRLIQLKENKHLSFAQFLFNASSHSVPIAATDHINNMHHIMRFMLVFLEHTGKKTDTVAVIRGFIATLESNTDEDILFRNASIETIEKYRQVRINNPNSTFQVVKPAINLSPENLRDFIAAYVIAYAQKLATHYKNTPNESLPSYATISVNKLALTVQDNNFAEFKNNAHYQKMLQYLPENPTTLSEAEDIASCYLYFAQSFYTIAQKADSASYNEGIYRLIVHTDTRTQHSTDRFQHAASMVKTASGFLTAWDLASSSGDKPPFIHVANAAYKQLTKPTELTRLKSRFEKEVVTPKNSTSVTYAAQVVHQHEPITKKITEPTNKKTTSAKPT